MKNFKKAAICVALGVIACAVLGMVSIPVLNNIKADRVKQEVLAISLPEKTEMVESLAQAGKLSGNGNGMQYFGAVLIRSELSIEELQAHYAQYREHEANGPFIQPQRGKEIEAVDCCSVQFSTEASWQGYYVVYMWGDSDSPLLNLDLRGH